MEFESESGIASISPFRAARGHSSGNGKLNRAFDLLHYCNAVVQRNLRNFKVIDVFAEVCHLARLYTLSLRLLRASLKT